MLELKTYQTRVLDAFSRWLDTLETAQQQSETAISAWPEAAGEIPDAVKNYPRMAWEKLSETGGVADNAREYVDRTDEANRPIPHICFKVPTGGGKTLLAGFCSGTSQSTNRIDIVDCSNQGNLSTNQSRTLESGTPPTAKPWSAPARVESKCWKRTTLSTETTLPITCASCC